jgi:radical SAM protein with 4Fe4S-binding SPASM domain
MVQLESPFTIWIQPTKRSNLDSPLAYDIPREDTEELSYDELVAVMRELFDRDVISLFFEGGEPFLRTDFLDLVRYATAEAFTMVRTNGMLVTDEVARDLKAANVGVTCVDIEGAQPRTHDRLTGIPGSFERSLAGVRALVGAGVSTYLTCILNRHNVGELQGLLELAAQVGAEKVGVLRLYPLGRARQNWNELSVPLPEQMAALRALRPPEGVELMQSWHPHDPNCCWQMAAVDAYGNSIGCPYLRDFANYGNVREESFMDTWRNPSYVDVRAIKVDDGCPECASNDKNTAGGCRSTAYAFHGRWDAPDPYCENMNNAVDLTLLPARTRDLPFGAPALSAQR